MTQRLHGGEMTEDSTERHYHNTRKEASGTFSAGHALIVSVANYVGVKPALPREVLNDGQDLHDVLTSRQHCGYAPANVRLLLDEAATLGNFRDALSELSQSCGADDTAVVFFSGHGAVLPSPTGETSALLPFDCKEDTIAETSLSEEEFSAAIEKIRAGRLVVLLDACHSAGAARLKDTADQGGVAFGYVEKTLARLSKGSGRILIASSRASETSTIFRGSRNSVFTTHLLEALRGQCRTRGDGLIRILDIFNHLSETVSQAVSGRQHPVMKAGDLENDFALALDRSLVAKRASSTESGEGWRRLEQVLSELYPMGPVDQQIWARAGGDLSSLDMRGSGRTAWFSALRSLRLGGGGTKISGETLGAAVLGDFPNHAHLAEVLEFLRRSIRSDNLT
jgi:hypothetical protein